MKQAAINLLKVKSIITLAIIGALVYLSVTEFIPSEAFVGIASSVVTYYFTRKEKGGADNG